jgi:aspartokinase
MPSIARAVEDNIRKKPFIEQALSRGIINYASLADELMPVLEKELGKKVKHSAVMMALRRLAEKLEHNKVNEISFTYDGSIQVRDGITEFTIEKTPRTLSLIEKLIAKIDYSKGDFMTVTQGIHEITILIDSKNSPWINKRVKTNHTRIDDLSSLTLFVPESAKKNPGFFYIITKELAWENININEIVSTENELSLIVASDDVPRVFSIIQNLLKKYRT